MERIFESEQNGMRIFVHAWKDGTSPIMGIVLPFYLPFNKLDAIDSLIDALQVAREEFANALYCGQEPVNGAPF